MAVCTGCMITTWICRLTPTAATAIALRFPVPAWAVCPIPGTQPPTDPQLNSLFVEAAFVARSWGWGADQITVERVMTHAEAASNRDGRWMHDNYGPVIWGGTGERWDLLQLSKNGATDG